jgi:hypothetical protein
MFCRRTRHRANPDLTQNSTADTALSLDGKDSTGQSVGQQCMDG